jgi:uncharacterized protein YjbI with pentapeptide repeats
LLLAPIKRWAARVGFGIVPDMNDPHARPGDGTPPQSQPGALRRMALSLGAGLLLVSLIVNVWLAWQLRLSRGQARIERQFWVVGHGGFSDAERRAAFLSLVAVGHHEWRGAHLEKLTLEGVDLSGADLRNIDLDGSKLARASLAGARLPKAKLTLTDLSDADLSEADMAGADLFKSRLLRAKLSRAKLTGANLEQAEAVEADLVAADLADAYLLMTDFTGASLVGATLTGANLEAAVFARANLSLARLDGVLLKDTDFTDSNWWRARGLGPALIADLQTRFPPSAAAPAGLRSDYQAWRESLRAAP